MKTCMKCGIEKEDTEFKGNNKKCIKCYKQYQAEYRKKHKNKLTKYWADRYKDKAKDPDYNKKHYTKTKYGITLEEYNRYFEDQPYCSVCGSDNKLVLDHCHTTGKIRGVLCDMCNVGIGRLGDTYAFVAKAAEYLQKAEEKIIKQLQKEN